MKALLLFLCVSAAATLAASDAFDFGFKPDAAGEANTAALQKAFDAGGTVRVTRPGRYELSGTVFIGDDTALVCDAGVYFVKTVDSKHHGYRHVILNKGALTKTWNKNIEITGLTIVVNGLDGGPEPVNGLRGQLAFFYAKNIRINRFRCEDVGRNQYCIHVCTFEDLVVDDVVIKGKKDGVHLGRGKRFTIRNGVFDTGDDPIALNAHDYLSGNPELGWIEDGVVENCHEIYNPETKAGYFCRILAGAWIDWREGMEVQQGDAVIAHGRLYRVHMPSDGKKYISKTCPSHEQGAVVLDGIKWLMVQEEVVYNCGVRRVVFRDCFLNQPRTAFSVHYDDDRYSRSHYPGAKPPRQEGIIFENINVLHTNKVPFVAIETPLDSLSIVNCSFRIGGTLVQFTGPRDLDAAAFGPTTVQLSGCRFYEGKNWTLLWSGHPGRDVRMKTWGNVWENPEFRPGFWTNGALDLESDLPGLQKHYHKNFGDKL